MSTISNGLRQLRCQAQLLRPQWGQPALRQPAMQLGSQRFITQLPTAAPAASKNTDLEALKASVEIPFQGVTHARVTPYSASYFSREPSFNDIYLQLARLLTKYHHLPTAKGSEVQSPWMKLDELRSRLGEPIKASHYAQVLRVAKRLQLIDPSVSPPEVAMALREFKRDVNPFLKTSSQRVLDKYGRAVGVGKRKTSTARAFVVEGTGEVMVNGKPLNEVFGRVHDRESAVWALQSTQRLDKYNVWGIVEGGGTTGQAEALTLAIAKALLVHERDLKTPLRKAGCITRDRRDVERKKHGHVKARKMPAWVKR